MMIPLHIFYYLVGQDYFTTVRSTTSSSISLRSGRFPCVRETGLQRDEYYRSSTTYDLRTTSTAYGNRLKTVRARQKKKREGRKQ